jgi:hypothetical protein
MSQSFPTIVYKCPGAHACTGGTYAYQGADDEASLSRLLSAGWFRTLPEAISGEHEDNSAPTREELEAKASELNIAFDGRTTDKKLAEKIEASLAGQE